MPIPTVQESGEESPLSAEVGWIMELMLNELDRQDRDPIVEFKANLVVDEAIMLAVEAFSHGSAPESDAHDQLCDLKAQTLVTATLLDQVEEWVAEQLEKLDLQAPIEIGGGGDSTPLIEDRPIKSEAGESKSAPVKAIHEVTEMGEQVVNQVKTLRYTVEEEEKKKPPAEQLPEMIKKEDKLAAVSKTEAPVITTEKELTKVTQIRTKKKSATLKAKLTPVKRLPASQRDARARHPSGDIFCGESGRPMKSNRIHPALLRENGGKEKRKKPVPAANKSLFSRLFSFFY